MRELSCSCLYLPIARGCQRLPLTQMRHLRVCQECPPRCDSRRPYGFSLLESTEIAMEAEAGTLFQGEERFFFAGTSQRPILVRTSHGKTYLKVGREHQQPFRRSPFLSWQNISESFRGASDTADVQNFREYITTILPLCCSLQGFAQMRLQGGRLTDRELFE
jgi:hypothetical protein